jgi:hypothetical protein
MPTTRRPKDLIESRAATRRCSECGRLLPPRTAQAAGEGPRALCDACYQWAVYPQLAGTEKQAFNPNLY